MRVGFIGVGHMGKYMAGNLLAAGHELTIFDVRKEARDESVLSGAHWANTPKAVAEGNHVVITSLPGPEQVEEVVLGDDGLLEGLTSGDFYVDMSTSTPSSIRKIATAAGAKGIHVLDAPVAGGIRGARKGTLTIMVGGTETAYDYCLSLLRVMGDHIFLVGDVGSGHIAKLVNNMMSLVNGLVAMEAMVVGAKAGVDVEKLLEVVEAGTGGSYALNLFRFVIFKGGFDPAKFALSLAAKDLRIAVNFAEDLGVPLTVIPEASKALQDALGRGMADRDWSSYITLIEASAGVEVRA